MYLHLSFVILEKPAPAKSKNIYRGKKRKGAKNDDDGTQDSDEEEDLDNLESKEVDYMSESSSGKKPSN